MIAYRAQFLSSSCLGITSVMLSLFLYASPSSAQPTEPVPELPPEFFAHTVANRLATLPTYDLDIDLNTGTGQVSVTQQVTWTNSGTAPVDELVFQVVPNNKLDDRELEVARRTVESLRIDPRESIDEQGRRFHLSEVESQGRALHWHFDSQHDTHLHVKLSQPVAAGQQVSTTLKYWIDIPAVQGRIGQYKGVTNLLNWYPILAVYDNNAWKPVPYVAWHQPWYNEAGNYRVKLRLPGNQKVVTGGRVVSTSVHSTGYQQLQIVGEGLRDFTIVASDRFQEWRSEVDGIPVRVLAFPEHSDSAAVAMQTIKECLHTYSSWFGPYPYKEFELTESYFGWNGNESSGMVMIDERIFDTPSFAHRYLEHLISHETCHQWWYSAVGTNGYDEPWMDEGLVQWFTRVRMEDKYGEDPELLDVPGQGILQFPNVGYRNLLHSSYQRYASRGGEGASLGSLTEVGHLHNLFSLVYDRGARVVGMIQHRMGREQFFEFMQQLQQQYKYQVLTAESFQKELENYTGQSWQEFFDTWLRDGGSTDWKLSDVKITETDGKYQTQFQVSQAGNINEPVQVGVSLPKEAQPFRYATVSELSGNQQDGISVSRKNDTDWLVTLTSETAPTQVEVDPAGHVLDGNPANNRWKQNYDFRVTPFYTPVDEAPLVQEWNGTSVVSGFGIDGEGRIGLRSSVIRSNHFRVSPFLAYTAATARSNDDHISAGVDAIFFNLPADNWQFLARYEHALLSTLANDPGHQARFAFRKVLQYTSSLIYPNASYIDFYTRFGDNFFPDEDTTVSPDPRVENFDSVRAFGVQFHLDSQLPYWDPDRGFRFDAGYEHGFNAFGDGDSYNRINGQAAVVRRLSSAPGWLSETKLAGRIAGGYGWEKNGQHFRFGGPGRFRGLDASRLEGNAFWLTTLEWRFPLSGEIDYQVIDNTAALHSIDGALFYDAGRSYLFDAPQADIDHAIGGGLYFQIPLLSFVENLTVRTEYGYSLVNNTSAVWFGLYRAF